MKTVESGDGPFSWESPAREQQKIVRIEFHIQSFDPLPLTVREAPDGWNFILEGPLSSKETSLWILVTWI